MFWVCSNGKTSLWSFTVINRKYSQVCWMQQHSLDDFSKILMSCDSIVSRELNKRGARIWQIPTTFKLFDCNLNLTDFLGALFPDGFHLITNLFVFFFVVLSMKQCQLKHAHYSTVLDIISFLITSGWQHCLKRSCHLGINYGFVLLRKNAMISYVTVKTLGVGWHFWSY